MRGRTLNDSFVILDEAQNTTSEQMKMFLTRLGFNSKAVITGDVTQIDLPTGKSPGWWRPWRFAGAYRESAWCSSGKGCGAAQPGAADHPGVRGFDGSHAQRAGNGKAMVSGEGSGKNRASK